MIALGTPSTHAQEPFRYASAISAFQRAALPQAADGDFFTPMTSDAFRYRIASRLKAPGCTVAGWSASRSEVPRVGVLTISTEPLPTCLVHVLPRLPEELEYRKAGVAVVLVDTHANMVVDVLHGAFADM